MENGGEANFVAGAAVAPPVRPPVAANALLSPPALVSQNQFFLSWKSGTRSPRVIWEGTRFLSSLPLQ